MSDDLKAVVLKMMRENPTSFLSSVDGNKPVTRVMQCPRVDEDFTIWYATSVASNKIRQINGNPNVCTIFYREGAFCKASGTAVRIDDMEIKSELWNDDWVQYWPDGAEDHNFTLIKITSESVEFLDLISDDMKIKKVL